MNEFEKEEAQLQDCPVCGSRPSIYVSAAAEPYGRSMQTLSVDCSNTTGKHCFNYVGVDIDTDYIENGLSVVMTAWNSLKSKL